MFPKNFTYHSAFSSKEIACILISTFFYRYFASFSKSDQVKGRVKALKPKLWGQDLTRKFFKSNPELYEDARNKANTDETSMVYNQIRWYEKTICPDKASTIEDLELFHLIFNLFKWNWPIVPKWIHIEEWFLKLNRPRRKNDIMIMHNEPFHGYKIQSYIQRIRINKNIQSKYHIDI